jgi:hypothetical protein
MKDICNENCKILKKEIEADTTRQKDLPCSWIDRIAILKTAKLLKVIYRVNAILIKIPMTFFTETRNNLIYIEIQKTTSSQSILSERNNAGSTTIPDFILYCRNTILIVELSCFQSNESAFLQQRVLGKLDVEN